LLEWLALAAATAVSIAPIKAEPLVSPARWVRASDLPRSADEAAVTTFDLTIDQSGRPMLCTIVIASGSDRLDSAVCSAVMRRARFKPAQDDTGSPIPSIRRDRVIWRPDRFGTSSSREAPDIVVSLSTITEPMTDVVDVVVIIDSAGTVGECFTSKSADTAQLRDLACEAVRDPRISLPIRDAQGTALRGVRSFYVGFAPGNAGGVVLR
jgi:hypothetical protein